MAHLNVRVQVEDLLRCQPRRAAVRATEGLLVVSTAMLSMPEYAPRFSWCRRGPYYTYSGYTCYAMHLVVRDISSVVQVLASSRLVLRLDVLLADGACLVDGELDVASSDLLARQPRAAVVGLRCEQVRLRDDGDVLRQVASVDGLLCLATRASHAQVQRVRVAVVVVRDEPLER